MSENIVLGLDFGSDPVRTLAVSRLDGTEIASSVSYFSRRMEGGYSNPQANQFHRHPLNEPFH